MSSSRNNTWLLGERDDDYRRLRVSEPKEYFAGVRREWAYRVEESQRLSNDLIAMGVRVPTRHSLDVYPTRNHGMSWIQFKRKVVLAVSLIRKENNRMLVRRSRHYMYQLAQDSVRASGRELTETQEQMLLQNPKYLSDGYMSD